jgi:hypothetical protein
MFKYSLYTSCFNIIKNNFNYWEDTIPKWLEFINYGENGEIVIAVNTSEDQTLEVVKNKFKEYPCIKIIESNFDYNDYSFDGKIKNIALQNCVNEICIGLDLDEYPSLNKNSWANIASQFLNSNFEAVFIPVIDLCKSINHYKSIGSKWYMHKQGLNRGTWNQAKLENGKIDIKKSDTCELLNKNGNLCSAIPLVKESSLELIKKHDLPFIIHLGWLNWENRRNQNKTWQPVWSNRAGFEVEDIMHEEKSFDQIQVFEHNLNI